MSVVERWANEALPDVDDRTVDRLFIAYTALIVGIVLLPLLYVLPISLNPQGLSYIPITNPSLRWYRTILSNADLIQALVLSIQLGVATSIITTPLALLAAMGTRQASRKNVLIGFFLLPIFMPGISVSLALAIYFKLISVGLGPATIVIAHVLWAFPFAYIIVLTSMSGFDYRLKEAAYDLGANQHRAFLDIELPYIQPGVMGAAIFSFTLSFNEFSRTLLVRGANDTYPTFVWGRIQSLGLDPTIYAISGVTIVTSALLLTFFAYLVIRK